MKRYEGLLRPQKTPAPWPTRWVVVDTVGHPIPIVSREGIRQTGLESWHAIIITMRGTEHLATEEIAGANASSCWHELTLIAQRPGTTWVISPRALYTWTLLGLFERLMTGQLAIANDRPVRKRTDGDRGLGREPGLFMAADPPSAVLITAPGATWKLTWTCASNYGWSGIGMREAGLPACQELAKAVAESSALLARHQLGGWGITIGSMALRAWRSQHLKESLYVRNDAAYLALIERGGFGGRLYVAQTHAERRCGYYCDARGLYAELGRRARLPTGCCRYHPRGVAAAQAVRSNGYGCLAAVEIRNNGGRFPCRSGAQVTYPLGDMETVLAGPELEEAIKGDYVSDIGECCVFTMGEPLAGFLRSCQSMRAEAENAAMAHANRIAKALAVSLVGKLHAYDSAWEDCQPDYNDPIAGSWIGPDGRGGQTEYIALAGYVARRVRRSMAAHAIPEIALWIWSLGRCWLWERMQIAGVENVLYADTDGLVVNQAGYYRLADSGMFYDDRWGELRLVRGPVEVEVLGPKMLRLGDGIICAGAPRRQRSSGFAATGYWYRTPLGNAPESYQQGVFEEEYRERRTATR